MLSKVLHRMQVQEAPAVLRERAHTVLSLEGAEGIHLFCLEISSIVLAMFCMVSDCLLVLADHRSESDELCPELVWLQIEF